MEFKKYEKIYRLGHFENSNIFENENDEIVIQEKIDGANFRFYISKNNEIIFGSRNRQLTYNSESEINMNKSFKKCCDFIKSKILSKDVSNYHDYIFYGENCIKHSLNYDWDTIPIYLGFDIFDINKNIFLPFNETQKIFKNLGLEMVPLIDITKSKNLKNIDDNFVPISQYTKNDVQAEGVVFKNYDKQIFAKYVTKKFKERNTKCFNKKPTNTLDYDEMFIYKYATDNRIEKCIFKEINKGHKFDMSLMNTLIKNVYLDIINEEWKEILTTNWIINVKNIKKLISKRCYIVLNKMLINNLR